MATIEPFSPAEESLWRALMVIVKVLPRCLDSDLILGSGLTSSEYTTIMHLSEAHNRELRMTDLATATGLSPSRMTRLVDDLQSRSLVTKVASSTDARGNLARLTPRGMAKLRAAWPVHLGKRSDPVFRSRGRDLYRGRRSHYVRCCRSARGQFARRDPSEVERTVATARILLAFLARGLGTRAYMWATDFGPTCHQLSF